MIYLITGNMGTGKTSRAVNMILTNEDDLFKMTLPDGTIIDRPLYFCHIDGLDARKFSAHELSEQQIQSEPLHNLLPTGAVLIVDEAHYTYPVRSAAKAVPEYIQKLAEIRHDGHTLILMTQHPMQLDIFVRNLVSKHIHLERKSMGMKQYMWYKCVTELANPANITGVESKSWKPPKEAFKYYKSSSQHVEFKKKLPLAIWVLALILAFVAWKGYNIYQSYNASTNKAATTAMTATPAEATASAASDVMYPPTDNIASAPTTTTYSTTGNLTARDFVPTLAEKPESKPIYNPIRQVKQIERVAACINGGKSGCTCYSDQATPIREITPAMCQDYAQNGLPFDPFREKPDSQPTSTSADTAPNNPTNSDNSSTILSLSGQDKLTLNAQPVGIISAGQ